MSFAFSGCWHERQGVTLKVHVCFVIAAMAVDGDGESNIQMLPTPAGADVDGEESLPPLEKARRRRSMMPS